MRLSTPFNWIRLWKNEIALFRFWNETRNVCLDSNKLLQEDVFHYLCMSSFASLSHFIVTVLLSLLHLHTQFTFFNSLSFLLIQCIVNFKLFYCFPFFLLSGPCLSLSLSFCLFYCWNLTRKLLILILI